MVTACRSEEVATSAFGRIIFKCMDVEVNGFLCVDPWSVTNVIREGISWLRRVPRSMFFAVVFYVSVEEFTTGG